MTAFKHILLEDPPYQVLSFDAGGIYGLSTSIMLRKLCEKNDDFLNGKDVTLFVGTSIGGLISLYLAMFERPRDAVLQNDNMKTVFSNPLLYSNMLDPVQGFLSLCGLTAWSGEADFKTLLKRIFQDKTLGDLKHRVMITCFNYHGQTGEGGENSGWRTNIYTNFLAGNEQLDAKIADVAYNACSFPGLRPLPEGLSDGGIFAPDPAVAGIAAVISRKKSEHENIDFGRYVVENVIQKIFQDLFDPLIGTLEKKVASSEAIVVIDEPLKATIAGILKFLKHQSEHLDISFAAGGGFVLADLASSFHHVGVELKKLEEETSIEGLSQTLLKLTGLMIGKAGLFRILGSLDVARKEETKQHLGEELDAMAETLTAVEGAVAECFSGETGAVEEQEHSREEYALKFFASLVNNIKLFLTEITPALKGSLEDITLLSLGTAQKAPYYRRQSINLSTPLFSLLPTNPATGNWYPPQIMTTLEAPSCGTNQGAEALLCRGKYRRLNPPVIQPPMPPVLPATYYARNPFIRGWIINGIYSAMKSGVAQGEIAETIDWLEHHWHKK